MQKSSTGNKTVPVTTAIRDNGCTLSYCDPARLQAGDRLRSVEADQKSDVFRFNIFYLKFGQIMIETVFAISLNHVLVFSHESVGILFGEAISGLSVDDTTHFETTDDETLIDFFESILKVCLFGSCFYNSICIASLLSSQKSCTAKQ